MTDNETVHYGPILGFATSALGTLAAMLLFPEQPSPPGALSLPAIDTGDRDSARPGHASADRRPAR